MTVQIEIINYIFVVLRRLINASKNKMNNIQGHMAEGMNYNSSEGLQVLPLSQM